MRTSPCLSILLTRSCPPRWRLHHFSEIFGKNFCPVHFPGIFMYLLPLAHLMHGYLSASADHSVRCFIPLLLLSTKLHFSFDCGLSSSQSFHYSTEQWKLAAHCKATYTSTLPYFNSISSHFCHKDFIQHCSCFCQLTSLLIFPQCLCSFRTLVECHSQKKSGQRMMSFHPNQRPSQVLSTLGQCFVSSQPVLCRPHTQTRIVLFLG